MSKLKLSSNASGSGNVTLQSPNTNSDFTVTVPSGTGALPLMKLETAKTATGTAVDFTDIPPWAKRITVMFSGLSTSGTSIYQCQIGDSGGIENSGYAGGLGTGGTFSAYSAGFIFNNNITAASVYHGAITLVKLDGNLWVATTVCNASASFANGSGSGSKTLSDTLDRVRITTVNGTDTFDAGTINILYEG